MDTYDKICFNQTSFDLYDKFIQEAISILISIKMLEEKEMYEDCIIMLNDLDYARDEFSTKIASIIKEPFEDVREILNETITTTKIEVNRDE